MRQARSDEAAPDGNGSGLAAAGDAQLVEEVAGVAVDGAGGDEEGGGDLGVGEPPGEEGEDLPLAGGEPERIGGARRRQQPRRRAGVAGEPAF